MADTADEKQARILSLLAQPLLARLATSNPATSQPHVVTVWFMWDGDTAWVSSFSSTRKVKELVQNPNCALLVEPPPGSPGLQAVLLEGRAELVREPREFVREMALRIYTLYLGPQGVQAADPQSWANDPQGVLVRLKPAKIYSW